MNKFKGTPGVWSVGDGNNMGKVVSDTHGIVCEIGVGWDEEADTLAIADAIMLSASKDMFEALSGIMNHHASNVLFHNKPMAEKAWSALAKALGQ